MSNQENGLKPQDSAVPRSDRLKFGSAGLRGFDWRVWGLGFVVVVLLAAVFYLLSALNAKRYSIELTEEGLVVKKGRFFPVGMRNLATDPKLGSIYGPLALPKRLPDSLKGFEFRTYEDLVDLNLALSDILLQVASDQLQGNDIASAQGYLGRAEKLSGLDEKRLNTLRRLKGNIAHREAVALMEGVDERLRLALEKFRAAQMLGSDDAAGAAEWISKIEKRLDLRQTMPLPGQAPPPPAQPLVPPQPQP